MEHGARVGFSVLVLDVDTRVRHSRRGRLEHARSLSIACKPEYCVDRSRFDGYDACLREISIGVDFMRTTFVKKEQFPAEWLLVDADGMTLGRLASMKYDRRSLVFTRTSCPSFQRL